MFVHVIADHAVKLAELRAMLKPRYTASAMLLDDQRSDAGTWCDTLVVAANLRCVKNIEMLKEILPTMSRARRKVFIIEQKAHLGAAQAYALGATRVVFAPVNHRKLLSQLVGANDSHGLVDKSPMNTRQAAAMGADSFKSMFSAVLGGKAVDLAATEIAGKTIANSILIHGLSNWLDTVRQHHEGTYQHCLLVTGIAVDFGLSLGLTEHDVQRLCSAAMFHDIGKSKIPVGILDKPARLDQRERALIETHPAHGENVLKATPGISQEILNAVRHHHEYLDGSGYPDGLDAADIPDVVRILTISDIFSALIETRPYKPSMARTDAYDIVTGMIGKLERPLVMAFKDVALNR